MELCHRTIEIRLDQREIAVGDIQLRMVARGSLQTARALRADGPPERKPS